MTVIDSKCVLVTLLALSLVPAVDADSALERTALARLVHEFTVVEALVVEAELMADPDGRTDRYQCLRGDLHEIRAGVETHLEEPTARTPLASVTPLCADYFGFTSQPRPLLAEAERPVLARLAHELGALEPLIARAEAKADAGNRLTFQYARLRRDLTLIQKGLNRLIHAPQTWPRAFPPLVGDYRGPP